MSTPDANDTEMADRAEALLAEWPAPERSAVEWEDTANLVMNRVRETEAGSTTDDLLGPPLAAEPDEPSLAMPGTDEPKLADIARAVVSEGVLAANEIARDGLLAAEQGRREPSPSWQDPARTARGANAASLQGRVAQRPGAREEARARSELPTVERDRDERRPGFAAGLVGGAVIALAASAALYVSMRQHDAESVLAAASAETVRAREAVPREAAPTTVPTMASAVALGDLPEPKAAQRRESPSGAAKESLAFRVQNAPKGKLVLEERPETQAGAPEPGAAAAPPAKQAATPTETAASDKGEEPQPSLGAVQAAVGSVMAGARSCLAGQEEGSKASLVFGSSGRVKSVGISGPAAGTPAESCLRSALMSAQVPPFSDPAFSASLTIRPP